MLNKPALNQLMEHVGSKYELVIIAAKRARAVIDNNPDITATGTVNAVSKALDEIAAGKLQWEDHAAAPPPKENAD